MTLLGKVGEKMVRSAEGVVLARYVVSIEVAFSHVQRLVKLQTRLCSKLERKWWT